MSQAQTTDTMTGKTLDLTVHNVGFLIDRLGPDAWLTLCSCSRCPRGPGILVDIMRMEPMPVRSEEPVGGERMDHFRPRSR